MKYADWQLRYKIFIPVFLTFLASNFSLIWVFDVADRHIGNVIIPKNNIMEDIRVNISSLNNECREYIISAQEGTLEEIDDLFLELDRDLIKLKEISPIGESLVPDIKRARLDLGMSIKQTVTLRDQLEDWSDTLKKEDLFAEMTKIRSREGAQTYWKLTNLLENYLSRTKTFILFPKEQEEEDHFNTITLGIEAQIDQMQLLANQTGEDWKQIISKCQERRELIGKGVSMGNQLAELLEEIEELELANTTLLAESRLIITEETSRTFHSSRSQMLVLMLIYLVVISLIVWLVARSVGKKLNSLTNATHQFGMEQLDFRVSVFGQDEIGSLATSFNHMADDLELNIRARKKTEVELVRKERLAAIGNLTATVSHELRNPLGAIRASLGVIKKLSTNKHPLLINSLVITDRSINRCDTIISDLLGFAKIRKIHKKPIFLAAWVDELIVGLKIPPEITLKIQIDKQAKWHIDPEYFHRALLNLIQNGIQAIQEDQDTGKEKTLTIDQISHEHRVGLSVSDTGCGIKPEFLEQIFEPLYSSKNFGTGLGLPTVKQIIEDHGGTIDVQSTWGKGARFTLWLPPGED